VIAFVQETLSFDTWQPDAINHFNRRLEESSAEEILAWAIEQFGEGFSIGSAFGASGMALIDIAMRINPDVDIFYIDTDYFFPETLALIERAQRHYNRPFRRVTTDISIAEQERTHGPDLYRSNPDKCCSIRKVVPMGKALLGSTAWVSALRRDQSPTRAGTPVLRWNDKYEVVKVSPLVKWTEADVWAYIHTHDVPYNELHERNYPSIGCWPCTQAVQPGGDLRAGRWVGLSKLECGLHLT
jgi:phosphoadenosine phosphosulfate reductase